MRRSRHFFAALFLLLAMLSLAGTAGTGASAEPLSEQPVPSLEPAKTAALWNRLVSTRARQAAPAAECRPLRAVFYAASDWLRLATKLAAAASPCAEYYVSVPPLVADKTTFRRDQASRIRALGPNFHAMAEIHFATWTRWVASTGSSWYTAGVTARQRMAEAGYDVSRGDSWMLNELTSAVRRGDGNARANVRELLRGLYEGDGSRPTRGAALVIGFGQRTADVSAYQNTLQGWLSDTAFWTDMATYVSDWSQEVYGDLRAHAVPGSDGSARREFLNDYLQHKLVLAGAGPAEIEPARAYLREAYSPLANGAWPRETAWGWTQVPFEQMAAYVSAQVDAMRSFSVSAGQAGDHWGFAWAPRNTTGLPDADFASQTGQILDRMAVAIRDSGVADPENPDSGACGVGQTLCAVDLPEASHNGAWRSFRTWAQSTLTIGPAAPTAIVAGVPSLPLELSLASAVARPVAATLRSSSPAGTFSTSAAGPWTTTLTLSISPGIVAAFYYRDTRAGVATLTAAASGTTQAVRAVTVSPGPTARVTLTPTSREVRARGEFTFTGATADAFGNRTPANISWSVTPAELATFVGGRGGTATLRAGRLLGGGTVTATVGSRTTAPLIASAPFVVTPATLRIASVSYGRTARGVEVTLATADAARRPISRATITLVASVDGRRGARVQTTTGAAGKARVLVPRGAGCYVVTATRVLAEGFTWNGRTPRNRFCRR